jgi:hypothetical protein
MQDMEYAGRSTQELLRGQREKREMLDMPWGTRWLRLLYRFPRL